MKKLLTLAALTNTSLAMAHDGHGQGTMHWHATDVWGFVAVGVVAALIFWLRRDK
jgi:hypothetical protein